MKTAQSFDVIVVGGGHAGIEAAYAAATMGSKTLLLSLSIDKIGTMPCNPSIGGVGKGHIVFEISALGGLMPQLCTQTYLQARMLNTSKGPAVQGLRLQIDKDAYSALSQKTLLQTTNLTVLAGKVETVLQDASGAVQGVTTADGNTYTAPTIILTTGTFLNGLIHVGKTNFAGGRRTEDAVTSLAAFLRNTGLRMGRLKTGTPPRLLRSSVNTSIIEEQEAHQLDYLYEFHPVKVEQKIPCYITHTNETTHQVLLDNMHLSPILSGLIKGKPPRYCPSIEDKIKRFPDKSGHHVFVEPETAAYEEVYPSGLSTSMPLEVQEKYIRTIKGFENAIITKPGYAVEYDFVEPDQLHATLEVKTINGLFLAGQINGTTGYEEAAGQGIIAGINAALKAAGKAPFILSREESYIGIMIHDLVTLGVDEPYRMFTSRAERRIILRQDNVFYRLSKKAYDLGMIHDDLYAAIKQENDSVDEAMHVITANKTMSEWLKIFGELACDPYIMRQHLGEHLSDRAIQQLYAEVKYAEYLKREQREVEKAYKYKNLIIPATLTITGMPGLSKELQEKLIKHKPATIADAMLIPGMTPAAISLLIFKIRELQKSSTESL